jgi:hypothetical protein
MQHVDEIDRVRVILMRLRDQLLEHEQRFPHPQTLIPAENATQYNEALAELEGVFGATWVESLAISRWSIVPASSRPSGSPAIPSVNRTVLLSHLRTALRRLDSDTPLPQDVTPLRTQVTAGASQKVRAPSLIMVRPPRTWPSVSAAVESSAV